MADQLPNILAVVVPCTCLVAILLWAAHELRKSPYTLPQGMLYFFNLLLCRILWRLQIHGRIDIPRDQGAILACNHRGSHDPVFTQLASDRVVSWFVAREYCEMPGVGHLLAIANTIPANRGGIDIKALRMAMRVTAKGGFVGMVPEGRINATDQLMLPGRPGVAMVALNSRVPVIPCFLANVPYDGTFWGCIFMPAKVHLTVGQPLDFSAYYGRAKEREVLVEVTTTIMKRIAELGGYPDFQPVMAGRDWKTSAAAKVAAQREAALASKA